MPLVGKGSKNNYFQTGTNEVVVELVGFMYWIAENMNGTVIPATLYRGVHGAPLSLALQTVRTYVRSIS